MGRVHELLIQVLQSEVATGAEATHNAGVRLPDGFKDENLQPAVSMSVSAVSDETIPPHSATSPATTDARQSHTVSREFEFPGVMASVPAYCDEVMELVSEYCPDEGERIDIFVAVQEALANAAFHGCNDDPSKRIRCVVTVDESDIAIVVCDPGSGFDLALADPEKFRATTLTHGRGICLMLSLMTEVRFAHNGAEIQLRKRLSEDR